MDEQNPRVTGKRPRAESADRAGSAQANRDTRSVRQTPSTAADRARTRSGTAGAGTENPEVRTDEIRAEIEQTREDLSETVDAIQDRLRPSTIASNAADRVKESAMNTARDVAESDSVMYVRANPIPTAMVGIGIVGLTWLVTRGGDGHASRRSYRGQPSDNRDWRTHSYYESSDAYRWDDASDYSRQRSAGPYGTSGWRSAEGRDYLPGQLRRTWNQTPLLIGAAAMVLGAIVGLTVPETERENELMGETRDNMLDSVQETVRDKVTEVQQAASDAASMVQDAAKSAVGLVDRPSNKA
jgi:hypothetical protein